VRVRSKRSRRTSARGHAHGAMTERGPLPTIWVRRLAIALATVAFIAAVVLIIASITAI